MTKFVLFCLLAFGYGWAHSETETIPATGGTEVRYQTSGAGVYVTSAVQWAAWAVGNNPSLSPLGSPTEDATSVRVCNLNSSWICVTGTKYTAQKPLTCPDSSWSLSGSNCVRESCPAGTVRNIATGACQKDCSGKVGQAPPMPSYEFPNGGPNMVGGCEVACDTTKTAGVNQIIPAVVVQSNCRYTGKSYADGVGAEGTGFTPKPDAPKKPGDCTGAGMGYIQSSSGSTTCIASKDSPPDTKPKTTEKKQTTTGTAGTDGKPDPTKPDYEKKETSSTSSGGTTKTTETTTKNPDEAGACQSGYTKVDGKCVQVKVTEESDGDYCTKNPNASQCKDAGDSCKENPDRVGCMDQGEAPDEGAVETKTIGVSSITAVSLASNNGCPSGPTLPKGLGVYNWEPMCDFAGALKPIVLAFAWLAAGLIVLGAIRD